jgi:hypothetical protein
VASGSVEGEEREEAGEPEVVPSLLRLMKRWWK